MLKEQSRVAKSLEGRLSPESGSTWPTRVLLRDPESGLGAGSRGEATLFRRPQQASICPRREDLRRLVVSLTEAGVQPVRVDGVALKWQAGVVARL